MDEDQRGPNTKRLVEVANSLTGIVISQSKDKIVQLAKTISFRDEKEVAATCVLTALVLLFHFALVVRNGADLESETIDPKEGWPHALDVIERLATTVVEYQETPDQNPNRQNEHN